MPLRSPQSNSLSNPGGLDRPRFTTVLFRQRMKETKEIPNVFVLIPLPTLPLSIKAILPVLCNQQRPKEAAMTFSFGISDDVTDGRFLRLHLEP